MTTTRPPTNLDELAEAICKASDDYLETHSGMSFESTVDTVAVTAAYMFARQCYAYTSAKGGDMQDLALELTPRYVAEIAKALARLCIDPKLWKAIKEASHAPH